MLTIFISNAFAQVEDVFDDVEEKGSLIIEFLTSGFFAILVVTAAIIYIAYMWMQRKIEITTALIIFLGAIALGNAPRIAEWLIG
jgi:uncharacterized membrane protein YvlD (DUF360 family)